jgi:hypothetical protein
MRKAFAGYKKQSESWMRTVENLVIHFTEVKKKELQAFL